MHHWSDLDAWKLSHQLVLDVYRIVSSFPIEEKFNICSQIKRAAYSIPSNIVEGHSKKTSTDFVRYLYISRGSTEELRYFFLLSKDLNYIDNKAYNEVEGKLSTVSKLINGLIKSLNTEKG